MPQGDRVHWRAALRIHEALSQLLPLTDRPPLPCGAWNGVQDSLARLRSAQDRGWRRASQVCEDQLQDRLTNLINQLQHHRCDLAQHHPRLDPWPVRTVLEDLVSLQEEFSQVTIDLRESQICVTTEPVILEDVTLGSFAIVLDWRQLLGSRPYRVVPQEPNPAASNEEITHPHVANDQLCEGVAQEAIRNALREGRLLDFFVIVRQVLSTYNASSAYIRLEDWDGVPCVDCGGLSGDEYDSCTHCSARLCEHCSTSCGDCGERHCSACLEPCPGCGNLFCAGCLGGCSRCSKNLCSECHHDECCEECPDVPATERAQASPLQPDGLGQTDLSA